MVCSVYGQGERVGREWTRGASRIEFLIYAAPRRWPGRTRAGRRRGRVHDLGSGRAQRRWLPLLTRSSSSFRCLFHLSCAHLSFFRRHRLCPCRRRRTARKARRRTRRMRQTRHMRRTGSPTLIGRLRLMPTTRPTPHRASALDSSSIQPSRRNMSRSRRTRLKGTRCNLSASASSTRNASNTPTNATRLNTHPRTTRRSPTRSRATLRTRGRASGWGIGCE